jgi:hypothetical protein
MAQKALKWKAIIKNGQLKTEAVERIGEGDCRELSKIHEGIGQIVSDETTGPFCDTAREVTTNR